jgi:hypothetical protein
VVAEENRSWAVTLCCWSEHMQLNQSIAFVQHAHYLSNRRRTPAPLAIRFEPFERLFPKAGW